MLFFLILFVTYEFEEVKRGGGEADTHTHIDRTAKREREREREKERNTSTNRVRARARARARDRDGERYMETQKWCHAKQRDSAREWERLGDTCRSEYTLRIDIHNFCV